MTCRSLASDFLISSTAFCSAASVSSKRASIFVHSPISFRSSSWPWQVLRSGPQPADLHWQDASASSYAVTSVTAPTNSRSVPKGTGGYTGILDGASTVSIRNDLLRHSFGSLDDVPIWQQFVHQANAISLCGITPFAHSRYKTLCLS
jgi:hypothetical protein